MRTRTTRLLGIAGIFALLAGCGSDGGEDVTDRQISGLSSCSVELEGYYYLGELMHFTGELEAKAQARHQALTLAINQINAAGGVQGKSLGLVRCDTGTDPATAQAAMSELAAASPLPAVIGPGPSASVLTAAPEATAAGKVMVSFSGTSPEITGLQDSGLVFRTCASDAIQGFVAASIAEREGIERVFIINRDDAYGNGLREVFTSHFTTAGGATDYAAYPTQGDYGEAAIIQSAMAFNPDAIFLVSFVDDGATFVNAAIAGGLESSVRWIISDGPKSQSFIDQLSDAAYLDNCLGTSPAAPKGRDYENFFFAFQEAYSGEPNNFAANIYDAAYLLAIAMQQSSDPDDPAQIKNALAQLNSGTEVGAGDWEAVLQAQGTVDYQGASGPVDFDANGDVVSDIEEWTVRSGRILSIGCFTPEGQTCL